MCAKKIAVLTSGGDAPGMNAAVRAVVRTAISFGMEVYGVRHGYNGLLTGEVQKMELRSVSNIIQHGGTALFTARSPEFNTPEGVQKAAAKCRELGIDGVVVVGGDGSFRGARDLTGAGVPCIGVPGTIDNDISSSEYTIGYDTAMNTAMEMIDRIRDTTESHDRCSVVEVMGRRCGDIALNTGIAVGAIATLVPEVKYDFEKDVIERIRYAQKTGKRHFIVVVAEGVGHSEDICKRIQEETGIESRATILGHVQRVNTYAFQHPIELMQNIDRVTEHIREKCPNTKSLHFHHTKHGVNYLMDNDGFWRLSNYVPSVTFDTCDDLNVVRSAGEAFGDFQLMLADFDANSLFYTIPNFHNTRKRYEKLKEDMAVDPCNRVAEVREELDWLLSVEDEACRLTDLFEKGELPLRVTHNDTKINNVLFDEKTHEALVVIDLDTVMPGLVGHDFGDAIRFAANFVEEDCDYPEKAGVNLNIFWAFAEGFLKKTAASLTKTEVDTLALSCFALTCELATRFLADYIVGDKYFKVKKPQHNLVRTRCQIALAKDMLNKMDAMNAIVQDCARRYKETENA